MCSSKEHIEGIFDHKYKRKKKKRNKGCSKSSVSCWSNQESFQENDNSSGMIASSNEFGKQRLGFAQL